MGAKDGSSQVCIIWLGINHKSSDKFQGAAELSRNCNPNSMLCYQTPSGGLKSFQNYSWSPGYREPGRKCSIRRQLLRHHMSTELLPNSILFGHHLKISRNFPNQSWQHHLRIPLAVKQPFSPPKEIDFYSPEIKSRRPPSPMKKLAALILSCISSVFSNL